MVSMRLKAAVIGIGKAGSLHLETYTKLPQIDKVIACDIDKAKFKGGKKTIYLDDYQKIPPLDLVSVATPTTTHFKIAKFFLQQKTPVLVEKPIASSLKEANALIRIAKKNKTPLLVGHIERFNSAYVQVKKFLNRPRFIECHRLSNFPHRSLDISVVLDLMIHDLDLILELAGSPLKKIEGVGVKVLSSYEDIANARLTFANGCIANVTASRISKDRVRKIRAFLPNRYVAVDFAAQDAEIYEKKGAKITKRIISIKKEEPIKKEIQEFIRIVQNKKPHLFYAQRAKEALKVALKIEKLIRK